MNEVDQLKRTKIIRYSFLIILILLVPFLHSICINDNYSKINNEYNEGINTSGEQIYSKEWLKNNNFSTQDNWFFEKGDQGDNETIDADITTQANFKILGEELNYTLTGIPNSTDSPDWYEFAKPGYYLPDNSGINSFGCRVAHSWNEKSNQFPGVQWRKNVSIPVDMTDYNITSATLDVIINGSVRGSGDDNLGGVDVLGESYFDITYGSQFANGDFVTFYVIISDIDFKNPYIIALNRTSVLGDDNDGIESVINDILIYSFGEDVIITALNSAFEKDPTHSNFTIALGIDIYSEDNWGDDMDTFNYLFIKDCNLTFTYERKIDKFTSISWSQIGNNISGDEFQIESANLRFKYKIDQKWPTNLSAFSEIRILINDNPYGETISLSSANLAFGPAKVGGFDVTNLILKDVNITLSIQVFIANTFGFDQNITISIDDVSLSITYIETVPDIPTILGLFLNNENKTLDPIIIIPYGVNLNITVKYLINSTRFHIPNATIQLEGKIANKLTENLSLGQYSILFNTSLLGIGIKVFTIEAQKNLYGTQLLQFYVDVRERETELNLYIDNAPKNEGDTVHAQTDDFINVTVVYKDISTNREIRGAIISLEGFGVFNEIANQYYLNLSARDLTQKINSLTISAQLYNYSLQNIQFFIEVIERTTDLQLFINSEDKTDDPVTEKPITSILNITVKYNDNISMQHLSNSSIQLIGNSISYNFTENLVLQQYSLTIITTSLTIGVNLFEIRASKSHYETQTINLRITINKINTLISTESGSSFIDSELGETINLSISITDVDFSGVIEEAIVTYRWAYGQGNLTELDDGNYEIILENVPVGIYIITITVTGEENYNFESYEITLSVTQPVGQGGQTWLVYVLIAAILGVSGGFTAYQLHFKYPPLVRKMRKLRKSIRKGKKTKPIIISKREATIKFELQNQAKILDLEVENLEKKIPDKIEKISKNKFKES